METTRVSQNQFAKMIGVHRSYVGQLIREGKIPANPDGTVNPIEAEEARRRHTLAGIGHRRWERRHPEDSHDNDRHRCIACQLEDESYAEREALECDSPDPTRFCSLYCALEFADGYTVAQVRKRQERESWTSCKGHTAMRGGDSPGTVQLLEQGWITEEMLDGISDADLIQLVAEKKRERRAKKSSLRR